MKPSAPPTSPPRFLVAQLGARMHYAVPRILHSAGMLERLYTDICATKGWPRWLESIPRRFRPPALRRLLGRIPDGIPEHRITAFSGFGCRYAWRQRASRSSPETARVHLWAGRAFGERVARGSWGETSAVYTFNGAGLEILAQARRRGVMTVVEQTIAPQEIQSELLREEEASFPAWSQTTSCDAYTDTAIARQRAEWAQADVIVCGSEFVRQGIAHCGGPNRRCKVVPYGVDATALPANRERRPRSRIRVLTAGTVGLRKGSPYVLAAARKLRRVADFRMVGAIDATARAEADLRRWVQLLGPVPRVEMPGHFQWADVFLLPSLCEGSAAVVYEALAAGVPVICTANTGSVVRDGVDGFIVPIRDADAIVQCIERLAGDPRLRDEMSAHAHGRALDFTVARYARRLLRALPSLCPEEHPSWHPSSSCC